MEQADTNNRLQYVSSTLNVDIMLKLVSCFPSLFAQNTYKSKINLWTENLAFEWHENIVILTHAAG
jgi:hypothetical protein